MNDNFKKLLKIGVGVLSLAATAAVAVIGGKNSFGYFLRNASDEELADARERVRLDFCNPHLDTNYRVECQKALDVFDREMSKRAWGDEKPHAPSYHREHGWYLPNDD